MRVRVKSVEGRKLLVGNGGSKSKGKGWMSTVFKHLQSEVNILPLLRQVAENWDDWYVKTTKQKNIRPQKETMTIHLIEGVPLSTPERNSVKKTQRQMNASHETIKRELYYKYDECVYFLNWFEKTYGGKLYRVSIVHLSAGGKVYPHIDIGDYYKNKDRFHLVLSGYYNYTVDDETQRFGAGDLFWFDNKKIHSSINATPIPRISLIFDVEGCTIC